MICDPGYLLYILMMHIEQRNIFLWSHMYLKQFWVKVDDQRKDVEWRPGDEKDDRAQVEDQVCPDKDG